MGNYFRSFPFFIPVERFESFNAAVRWTVACRRSRRRQHLSVPNLDTRTKKQKQFSLVLLFSFSMERFEPFNVPRTSTAGNCSAKPSLLFHQGNRSESQTHPELASINDIIKSSENCKIYTWQIRSGVVSYASRQECRTHGAVSKWS